MSWYSNMLNQKLTYWGISGFDKFSNPNFEPAVVLDCRWEFMTELYKDAEGNEKVSEAQVYVNQDLESEGYVMEGIIEDYDSSTSGDSTYVIGDETYIVGDGEDEFTTLISLIFNIESTDNDNIPIAYEIQKVKKVPSVKGDKYIYKVLL